MSWRDRNTDERADDTAEAGAVCIDCACVFDASHSARLCATHAAAPRMLEALKQAHQELRLLNVKKDGQQKYNTPASLVIESLGALLRDLRSEEHTSELQSLCNLVCRLLLERKKKQKRDFSDVRKENKKKNRNLLK